MPDFPDFIEGLVPGLDACYIEREVKSRGFHPDNFLGRDVPRPALCGIGGVKGHNMKGSYLSGKPRPVAG
jgi:hypothetical protein